MDAKHPAELELFDRALNSARQQKGKNRDALAQKREHMNAEWERVVAGAAVLRQRVQGDARVKAFNISARLQSIFITLRVREAEPPRFIHLSRHHPDQNYPGIEALWLRSSDVGMVRQFDNAQTILRELAVALAHALA